VSIALARKYRPKSFGGVAVQTHVANTLKGAIARGRVAHGYLLCGPRGTGKTTLARVLAMALNCERKGADGEPCGECTSCSRIWAGSTSLDVVEIDAASNRGVDEARDLRERAMYAPSGDDRYKVYIVDEAHMLTREAWNTLLKILEEPPPRVVFVFATTEPQKIAQAAAPVLSRLQRFDLKRIGSTDIRHRLTEILALEGIGAEHDAISMIARAADGSMRDALSLTDQVLAFGDQQIRADDVRAALGLVADDELLALVDLIAERRAAEIFAATARLGDTGADFGQLMTGLAEVLRAQLAIELGGTPPETSESLGTALAERRGRVAAGDLVRMLTILVEHEPTFRRSAHPQLLFESLLVRFALFDRTVSLEDVLRATGATGSSPRASGTSAPRSSAPDRAQRAAPPGVARDSAARRAAAAPQVASERVQRDEPPPAAAGADPAPLARPSSPARVLADAAPTEPAATEPLDVNRLAELWDDVVAAVRASGRGMVAQLLEEAIPTAVSAAGVVTLDAGSDLTVQGLGEAEATVIEALRRRFSGVTRLVVRSAGTGERRRYDAASVKAERTASLRSGSPLLAAAIDALDLELIE
jgi:DNA polymerase-3 subunit gamma/tau